MSLREWLSPSRYCVRCRHPAVADDAYKGSPMCSGCVVLARMEEAGTRRREDDFAR